MASSQIKLLQHLTNSDRQQFLDSFDWIFCDCDGVLWQPLQAAFSESGETVNFLLQKGKRITFVTNNSIHSVEKQLEKLTNIGIDIGKHDLITPMHAVAEYLKSANFTGNILCIAMNSFKDYLRVSGLKVIEEPERLLPDNSLEALSASLVCREPVAAVVMDIDFNLMPWKLMRAQLLLQDPKCLLLAGAADPLIELGHKQFLGPGSYLGLLEQICKRKAITLGKPGPQLGILLKQKYAIQDSKRVLFVGDSLESDIKFGQECGFQTLLVLTGATKLADLELEARKQHGAIIPDFVVEKLSDLAHLLV